MTNWRDIDKANVPEAELNGWKVEKFTVNEEQAKMFNLRAAVNARAWEMIKPGEYTKLTYNGTIWMSDTPFEIGTMWTFFAQAQGHVLINGLGLGVIAGAVAKKDNVEQVTVIEIEPNVIKLIGPSYDTPEFAKMRIIEADAFKHKPELPNGEKLDWVFHDIWPTMNPDNLEQMKKLHRRYGRWAKNQLSWSRDILETLIQRNYPY
jgi:hypothetical protein